MLCLELHLSGAGSLALGGQNICSRNHDPSIFPWDTGRVVEETTHGDMLAEKELLKQHQ